MIPVYIIWKTTFKIYFEKIKSTNSNLLRIKRPVSDLPLIIFRDFTKYFFSRSQNKNYQSPGSIKTGLYNWSPGKRDQSRKPFFGNQRLVSLIPPVNIFTLGIPVELHKLLTASIVVIITILLCRGLFSFKRFLNRITFATKYFVAFKNIIDFYKYISSKSLGISCIKLLNQFCQLLLQVLHQVLKLLLQDLLH